LKKGYWREPATISRRRECHIPYSTLMSLS
jgi:hypothetical protein